MLQMIKMIKKVLGLKRKKAKRRDAEKKLIGKTCPVPLTDSLQENVKILKEIFANSSDIVFREFYFGGNEQLEGTLVYIDSMIDKQTLQEDILKPLVFKFNLDDYSPRQVPQEAVKIIRKNALSVGQLKEERDAEKIVDGILSGHVAVLINFVDSVIVVNNQGWAKRNISEPENERIVRGPREGFVEDLGTNISLIRKKIKDVNLTVEKLEVGKRSKTQLALVYLRDLASPTVVQEYKDRLAKIEADNINAAGEIEQMIEDHPWSFFPQIQTTERPDKTVSNIVEGRVVLLIEGTPFVLIVPAILPQFMQAVDDYAERTYISSFVRILRYVAFVITATLPGVYIALISFHSELIPYDLVISIAQAREAVPFPPVLEALFMEATLELLREAGLRLPGPIGQTIGIVGGIVIGQAIVQAKIVSPVMVIVVALTAISSFTIPNYSLAGGLRITRFFLMVWAAFLGAVGLSLGLLFVLTQTVAMKSFGVPYTAPLAPTRYADLRDTIIRAPIGILKKKKPVSLPKSEFSLGKKNSPKKGKKSNE